MRMLGCTQYSRPVVDDEKAALAALRAIPDPELGVNIVDLGLVYGVEITEGHAHVTYTLTTLGCGIGPVLEGQMQEVLYGLAGITRVTADLVLDPPWTRDRMTPEVRAVVGDREFHPMGGGSEFQRLLDRFDQGRFDDPHD
jgi:metal-sulfur cluster biosynthetic enzyme